MTVELLKSWVWCEDCLEWKDTGEEVEFLGMSEDTCSNDILIFKCDKCGIDNKGNVVSSVTQPRGQ